ncbi:MAG: GntR family transcriptional regulator [Gemmatimonadaceae bacterium]|nr:GntR family transcriptional regulator [Gemmatimonadaceae bacterium]NUO96080.1 GntR family transcriptional regulator [Gemmatimonadaceae bacterium]NUP71243.1 GntR family transcriptional regulator [Gemmatimonadaceae bacterium]NUR36068.1 GntR family transcriptional regulator [Gemmatimonadaceae bacterium]NUS33814.1 GntR family transcriptional regulator [Gemmatimonadaceae bacterium]
MTTRLNPSSPIPLYHQLAEAIRADIAAGALAPGDRLPPLRAAADVWGVNLHTVRHAYRALAESGLVRTAGRGSIVLRADSPTSPPVPDEDVITRFLREAREQHGLSLHDIRRQLERQIRGAGPEVPDVLEPRPIPEPRIGSTVVHVIECSTWQALDLAQQVQERWQVTAKPWSLERAGEPPAGPLVATYFHYNDIRARWPKRLAQVQFASIRPDPALAGRVRGIVPTEARTTVILCEREAEKARNIAADLAAVLPSPTFEIRTLVSNNPTTALHVAGKTQPVLFAPRIWGALGPVERADPRAVEVRYLFDSIELAALGERFQWSER